MAKYDWGTFGFHIPEIMLPKEGTDKLSCHAYMLTLLFYRTHHVMHACMYNTFITLTCILVQKHNPIWMRIWNTFQTLVTRP